MGLVVGSDQGAALAMVHSSIFYNFYHQVVGREGSSFMVEKCHFADCSSDSIHAVNPMHILVQGSTFNHVQGTGFKLELDSNPKPSWVSLEQNEFSSKTGHGVLIQPREKVFAAQNLDLRIMQN